MRHVEFQLGRAVRQEGYDRSGGPRNLALAQDDVIDDAVCRRADRALIKLPLCRPAGCFRLLDGGAGGDNFLLAGRKARHFEFRFEFGGPRPADLDRGLRRLRLGFGGKTAVVEACEAGKATLVVGQLRLCGAKIGLDYGNLLRSPALLEIAKFCPSLRERGFGAGK